MSIRERIRYIKDNIGSVGFFSTNKEYSPANTIGDNYEKYATATNMSAADLAILRQSEKIVNASGDSVFNSKTKGENRGRKKSNTANTSTRNTKVQYEAREEIERDER